METVRRGASESIVFGHESPEKPPKSRKKLSSYASGRRSRKFESCHLDQKSKGNGLSVLFAFLVEAFKINLVVAKQQPQVRIPRLKICKLACKAKGVGITERSGVTLSPRPAVSDMSFGRDMRYARRKNVGEQNVTATVGSNITFAKQKYHAEQSEVYH